MSLKMKKILKAMKFAAKAHRDNYKKTTDRPYLPHPIRVGMSLIDEGFPTHVVIAGLLHDVAEDSQYYGLDDIEKRFGYKVRRICEEVTEDKSQEWDVRKKHTIETIGHADEYVQAVAAGDKVDNMTSILFDYNVIGDEIWSRFNQGKEKQIWYYTEVSKALCTDENMKKYPRLYGRLRDLAFEMEKLK